MFTPSTLTNEQRDAALKAMSDCLEVFADAGMDPEEAAACLMAAAWHALTHKAANDEAADYLRRVVDGMASGVPRQH